MAEDLAPRPSEPGSRRSAYRGRFALAYVALGAVGGVAVAAAVFLFGGPGKELSEPWSAWKPEGDSDEIPEQIAEHVARRYRLDDGRQLVGILAGPPEVQDVEVRAVAIQPEQGSDDDVRVLPAEGSVMYVLCGFGEACAIRAGRATPARHRLLRRQALELALYTFKYGDEIDSVIALLPPAQGEDNSTALFFEKEDLETELDRPLEDTLDRPNPPAVAVRISPAESVRIDRLTRPHLFAYEFQAVQDGTAVLVLAPLVATP